jgi:uncharacterized RDD family membrane protein YckC
MAMRFDEVELEPDVFGSEPATTENVAPSAGEPAPRFKRLLALLADLSLFVALTLALSPLLPVGASLDDWPALSALAGFVLMLAYYYFVGSWLLWGKTVGGAIFDVKVVTVDATPMDIRRASERFGTTCLSLVTAGLGFAIAALPGSLSLPDRMSGTRCVRA